MAGGNHAAARNHAELNPETQASLRLRIEDNVDNQLRAVLRRHPTWGNHVPQILDRNPG